MGRPVVDPLPVSVVGVASEALAEPVRCRPVPGRPVVGVLGRPVVGVLGRPVVGVLGRPVVGVLGRPVVGVLGRPVVGVLGRPVVGVLGRPAAVPSGRGVPLGVVSGSGVGEVSTEVKRAGRRWGDEQGRSRRPVCASSATTRVRTPGEPGAATAVPGAAGRDDGLATGPVGRRERPTWRG
ncbi:hypothetical protein [Micromonospora sp. NPDC005413]|uniref:hypothetical protein n=1 Tax=Micromonospora sp. NPDC005413 TaxID=3154563 RepID=UPI0033B93F8E